MEVLSKLIQKAEKGGYLRGFEVGIDGGEVVRLSHLLFANDTLIFCGAEANQIRFFFFFFWIRNIIIR